MLLLSLEGLYEATSLQLRVFFQEDRALKSSRPARVNKQGGSGFTEKLLVRMPSRKYEHNCQKSRCKDFGGSQICQHNRIRSTCKECQGSSICPHKREKSTCRNARDRRYASMTAAGASAMSAGDRRYTSMIAAELPSVVERKAVSSHPVSIAKSTKNPSTNGFGRLVHSGWSTVNPRINLGQLS